MRHVTELTDEMLDGISDPVVGNTRVVVKDTRGAHPTTWPRNEAFAVIVGQLLDVPVVPGFVSNNCWHSIFVEGIQTAADLDFENSCSPHYDPEFDVFGMAKDAKLNARLNVFDTVIGNMDRHEGNWGFDDAGDVILFDHNLLAMSSSRGLFYYWPAKSTDMVEEWNRAREILTPSVIASVARGYSEFERQGMRENLAREFHEVIFERPYSKRLS